MGRLTRGDLVVEELFDGCDQSALEGSGAGRQDPQGAFGFAAQECLEEAGLVDHGRVVTTARAMCSAPCPGATSMEALSVGSASDLEFGDQFVTATDPAEQGELG